MHTKTKNKLIRKQKPKIYFVLIMIIFLGIFIVFKDFGIIKYFDLQRKANSQDIKINQLTYQKSIIENNVKRLKYDDEYREYIARQNKFYGKTGERIYSIQSIKSFTP